MSRVLESILADTCLELFIAFGAALRLTSDPNVDPRSGPPSSGRAPPPSSRSFGQPGSAEQLAGTISFDGPAIRGMLLLVSSFDFIASCRPKELRAQPLSAQSAGDWIHARDWCKELTNQLLGRVKRRLIAHELTFEGRIPMALTGDAVQAALAGRASSPLRFKNGNHELSVWLDARLSPTAEQLLLRPRPQLVAREGDVLLF